MENGDLNTFQKEWGLWLEPIWSGRYTRLTDMGNNTGWGYVDTKQPVWRLRSESHEKQRHTWRRLGEDHVHSKDLGYWKPQATPSWAWLQCLRSTWEIEHVKHIRLRPILWGSLWAISSSRCGKPNNQPTIWGSWLPPRHGDIRDGSFLALQHSI